MKKIVFDPDGQDDIDQSIPLEGYEGIIVDVDRTGSAVSLSYDPDMYDEDDINEIMEEQEGEAENAEFEDIITEAFERQAQNRPVFSGPSKPIESPSFRGVVTEYRDVVRTSVATLRDMFFKPKSPPPIPVPTPPE